MGELDFQAILQDALSQGVLAPLLSLVVLPIAYRLVGSSKRERREREQQSIRLMMDLERGLGDLAKAANTDAERARFTEMRNDVLGELREKSETFFAGKRFKPEARERYYLLPTPRGFFSWIWAVLTLIFTALSLMLSVAMVLAAAGQSFSPEQDTAYRIGFWIGIALLIFVVFIPAILLRWFTFISHRIGMRRREARAKTAASG
ncbi:MAG: hypothetical protein AAF909_02995 [Pseudomonadota bacterium]